jgi:hypothetical protein
MQDRREKSIYPSTDHLAPEAVAWRRSSHAQAHRRRFGARDVTGGEYELAVHRQTWRKFVFVDSWLRSCMLQGVRTTSMISRTDLGDIFCVLITRNIASGAMSDLE